ncbi:glycine cleavage system protein T [Vannielia sp. SX4]|uniref:glycine cleavage system protein T n=1 Tax=Vannielia sp. SX4 TaxID=3463852 RepID=UPI004059CB78
MPYALHIGPNIRKSPYFEATVADGVQGFSVYNHMFIPGHFGDPEAEYERLLNGVAMWDVAAQRQVELKGPDAARLAQRLTPRDLDGMKVGRGRYVPICDHHGWLINDPVLLKLAEDHFWLSVADSDMHLWALAVARESGMDVQVSEPDVSPLAIQGPKAMDVAEALLGGWVRELPFFGFREVELEGIPLVVARSGWSKQGGVELYLRDGSKGVELWQRVKAAGQPFGIGPGAPNDTERLESGLISYGADMRRQCQPANPFEMGFGAMVNLDAGHDFIGRAALERIKAEGWTRERRMLEIEGAPVEGNAHPLPLLLDGAEVGTLFEMAHSRRLEINIAHGMLPRDLPEGATVTVTLPDGPRRVVPRPTSG